ncbi:type I-E CRISPR-associated protein Cas5/CasD [Microbacterium sp.]|uniref:type I-E CRISPR-associated protein Cas5/CasD n=1 Tax=Microbacterium sp. TaxID=51671 RepID=UPI002BFDE4A7|nr:type I-E CRISPR-associated protein Cas5/CasD [Microbacterium sp.]HWL78050.1 type I-E CRISPR-associated protein Cas5/CasD [Microbacterium sp.]
MTSTLLLRLAAPRQSWGGHATQRYRPTEKVPTRTGLEGVLHAALGVPRGQTSPLVTGLVMHVRVDRPGTVEEDFHTICPPPADIAGVRQRATRLRTRRGKGRADFTVPLGNGQPWEIKGSVQPMITRRMYLADAEFIAAFTGDDAVIAELGDAVRHPVFTPYLGRQAFAPKFPFHLGSRAGDGIAVLTSLPTTAPEGRALPVYLVEPFETTQVARIDPERTDRPLEAWKRA